MVAVIGAVWTAVRRPSAAVIGGVQHFAAGVVFYAAAGEVLPEASRRGSVWAVVAGAGAGIAAMLLLRRLTKRMEGGAGALMAASGMDALVDGVVLGLGFDAGAKQGLLLAIALALEFLFLGLSVAGSFREKARAWVVVGCTAGVSLGVPAGVLLAHPIARASGWWKTAAFSFGLIALLYLVAEELLTEAHERPETTWGTSAFFVGFVVMMVLSREI